MTRLTTSTTPAIGIDLGTGKCCVGVVREGKVEIIENERGSKTTPSYVAFTETERLVGEDAKDQVARNPTNTVFGVKRIIGRRFDDQSLQTDVKFSPFTVTKDEHGRPRIPIQYRKEEKVLSPEQVSAMMLEKMKCIAESHLGCEVRDAVISVPAYFNNSQRQATKDAGTIAGLNVLGLINEPTAAALAYRDNKALVEPHNVLIFDLGGGTFDVAVIRVDASGVKVKGVCGDAEYGGNEMDVLLIKHFKEEFVKKHGNSVFWDNKGLERLRTASEKAKKTLTLLSKANVQVDSLIGDIDFSASIKRHDFEQLYYADAKKRIINVLTNVLKVASISLSEIDEVVLVGGTSRVPKIQSILMEFFGGKALNKTVNPDEAVAHGAALQAARLARDSEADELYVDDMFQVPPSTENDRMDGKFRNYRAFPKESFHIHKYSIKDEEECDDESKKWFSHKEAVMKKYELNSYGIFDIYTRGNQNSKETRVTEKGCLAEPEIPLLAAQVGQFAKDDQELKEGVAAMSDLEALCFQTKALVTSNSLRRKLKPDIVKIISANCDEMIRWLDDNDLASKTEYQHKKIELVGRIQALMKSSHVKVDDFHGTDQKWFRKISSVESEQPSCGALKLTNQQQLVSSDSLSTQSAPQQQGYSAQPSTTLLEQGKSSSAQPTPAPLQQGQSSPARPTLTPVQQGQSSSAQPTPTPSEQVQSSSAEPSPTPLEQGQSNSAQPSLPPSEQGQSSSARPTPTPSEQGQSSSAKPSPTPSEQGQSSSAQQTITSLEQEQSNSAQPTPTPSEQEQSSSAQPASTSHRQGQSSPAHPSPSPPEQGPFSLSQPTATPSEQGTSSLSQPTATPSEQGQFSLAQSTPTPPQQGQTSSAQPIAALPEQGPSNSCRLAAHQGDLESSASTTVCRRAWRPESQSVQSVEVPQIKLEDETKDKYTQKSEGTEGTSRPPNFGSHSSHCLSYQNDTSVNSYTSDTQLDSSNDISRCSSYSGIHSPSVAYQSPANVVAVESPSDSVFIRRSFLESGNVTPGLHASSTSEESSKSCTTFSSDHSEDKLNDKIDATETTETQSSPITNLPNTLMSLDHTPYKSVYNLDPRKRHANLSKPRSQLLHPKDVVEQHSENRDTDSLTHQDHLGVLPSQPHHQASELEPTHQH